MQKIMLKKVEYNSKLNIDDKIIEAKKNKKGCSILKFYFLSFNKIQIEVNQKISNPIICSIYV